MQLLQNLWGFLEKKMNANEDRKRSDGRKLHRFKNMPRRRVTFLQLVLLSAFTYNKLLVNLPCRETEKLYNR